MLIVFLVALAIPIESGHAIVGITFISTVNFAGEYSNNPAVNQNLPALTVQTGDMIVVFVTRNGNGGFTISDSQSNSYVNRIGIPANGGSTPAPTEIIFTTIASASGSLTVTFQWATQTTVDTVIFASDYRNAVSTGNTGSAQTVPNCESTSSCSQSLSSSLNALGNSWIVGVEANRLGSSGGQTIFTEGSGQTSRGSAYATIFVGGNCALLCSHIADKISGANPNSFSESWNIATPSSTQVVLEIDPSGPSLCSNGTSGAIIGAGALMVLLVAFGLAGFRSYSLGGMTEEDFKLFGRLIIIFSVVLLLIVIVLSVSSAGGPC